MNYNKAQDDESILYQIDVTNAERKEDIVEFVRNNPGVIKQEVVNHFEGRNGFSRASSFSKIRDLLEDGRLVERERDNGRGLCLFVNMYNAVIFVTKEMDYFKISFFNLLDKLKQKIDDMEKLRNAIINVHNNKILESFDREIKLILHFLHYRIYEKFMTIYTFRANFLLMEIIHDLQTQNKLQNIIFKNLTEIQRKYYDFCRYYSTKHISLVSILYNKEICSDQDYDKSEIEPFEENGLAKELDSVLIGLYDINYRYAKTEKLRKDVHSCRLINNKCLEQ